MATAGEHTPGRRQAELVHAVFAFSLAVGVLLHEIQRGKSPLGWHAFVLIAAVGVLLRPASVSRLLALLGASALELATDLPAPWNHTLLLGIVGGVTLVWAGAQRVRGRPVDSPTLLQQVAPLIRCSIVLVWFAAAVAKMNEGYLDTANSCAIWIAESLAGVVVPSVARGPVIYGTIAVELAVPILLLVPRVRPFGVGLAWLFHALASAAGHTAFSGLAWPLYLLFLPPTAVIGILDRAIAQFDRRAPRLAQTVRNATPRLSGIAPWAIGFGLVVLFFLAYQALPAPLFVQARRWIPTAVFAVWVSGWIAAALPVVRERGVAGLRTTARLIPTSPILWAALGLLFVNALSPYLGAKTMYSFTMYSNIRTEPGHWNHLVVPEAVRILDWQDQQVAVFEGSDDLANDLEVTDDGPTEMPLQQLQVIAQRHPNGSVVYELDGESRVADPVEDDPMLADPGVVERRLSGLRRQIPGQTCTQ